MMSPYAVEGPAMLSFSGGRTSAYMLRQVVDLGLDADVHVLFANTGKEREETLDFIHEIEARWKVNVRWLEYGRGEVCYETASRRGEPFEALLKKRGFPPNPLARFCTSELKIRTMKKFMLEEGYEHWTNVVGIRWDEPRRVARLLSPNKERWDVELPLHHAKVTEQGVMDWWAAQPFDLQLRQDEGNCDLCFLKGRRKRLHLIRERPQSADWWIAQEAALGPFRVDTANYASMKEEVRCSPMLFPELDGPDMTDLGDCVCHD